LLVSGSGGLVYFDPVPCLRYRQHTGNVLGQNVSLRARVARIRGLIAGDFKRFNALNIAALVAAESLLTEENRRIFHRFLKARARSLGLRLWGLYSSGIYRQTCLGNLGLLFAAMSNKV